MNIAAYGKTLTVLLLCLWSLAVLSAVADDEPAKEPSPAASQLAASGLLRPELPEAPHLMPSYLTEGQETINAVQGLRLIAPVVLESNLNSDVARPGDPIDARLKDDLLWGRILVAHKNARVRGEVFSTEPGRTFSKALMSSNRRSQSRGCIAVQFHEIIDTDGRVINIDAVPCKQSSAFDLPANAHRELATDSSGRIIKAEAALSHNQKVAYNSVKAATILPLPASLAVNVIGVPVAMGAAGAADPDFAYNKPVDPNTQHKRAKGFAYAFVTNLPGALVVQSIVQKGNEVTVTTGDELALDIQIKEIQQRLSEPKLDVNASVLSTEEPRNSTIGQAQQTEGSAPLPGNFPSR